MGVCFARGGALEPRDARESRGGWPRGVGLKEVVGPSRCAFELCGASRCGAVMTTSTKRRYLELSTGPGPVDGSRDGVRSWDSVLGAPPLGDLCEAAALVEEQRSRSLPKVIEVTTTRAPKGRLTGGRNMDTVKYGVKRCPKAIRHDDLMSALSSCNLSSGHPSARCREDSQTAPCPTAQATRRR